MFGKELVGGNAVRRSTGLWLRQCNVAELITRCVTFVSKVGTQGDVGKEGELIVLMRLFLTYT